MFAFLEFIGPDELFSVFRPKQVVRRRADWLVEALDVKFDDLAGVVSECASHDPQPGARLDCRAWLNAQNLGGARDAAFGHMDIHRAANLRGTLFEPPDGTQQGHVRR